MKLVKTDSLFGIRVYKHGLNFYAETWFFGVSGPYPSADRALTDAQMQVIDGVESELSTNGYVEHSLKTTIR